MVYKRDKAKISERKRGRKKKVAVVYLMWVDVVYVNVYCITKNNNDELPQYSEQIYYQTSSNEKYPSVYV